MFPLTMLGEPVWQRLTWALLHFLWQGLAVASVAAMFLYVWPLRRAHNRYLIYLAALIAMVACPLVTFMAVEAPESAAVAGRETAMRAPLPLAPDVGPGFVATEIPVESTGPAVRESQPPPEDSETAASEMGDPASLPVPVTWEARLWQYVDAIQPYAMIAWMAGVLLLGVRLSLSWFRVRWLAWRRRVIPADLAAKAAALGKRLGLRLPPRVCVSDKIREAIVVGLWRPLVLLPVSWLMEMPPEMLEAVIAHELAHVRRLDLWVNLLQRLMETLLFYHPAVWWLSRRVSLEREMCADELAVGATSKRFLYATVLEQLGLMRLGQTAPQLGAAMGDKKMVLLNRVGNILGLSPSNKRARWWPAGLLALAVPLAIWLASTSIASSAANKARAEEVSDGTADTSASKTPRDRDSKKLTIDLIGAKGGRRGVPSFWIGWEQLGKEALCGRATRLLKASPGLKVVVRAGRAMPRKHVDELLKLLKTAGAKNVSLAAFPFGPVFAIHPGPGRDGTIRGTVIAPDNRGEPGKYSVTLDHEAWTTQRGELPYMQVAAGETFEFRNVPAGKCKVRAQPVTASGKNAGLAAKAAEVEVIVKNKQVVEVELSFDPVRVSSAWGKAAEGVQIRLWAKQSKWNQGTVPGLLADVRNQGKRNLLVRDHGCELEVDGRWYRQPVSGGLIPPPSPLPPGRRYDNIAVDLHPSWEISVPRGVHPPWKGGPEQLGELTPGKHTIRVAFTAMASIKARAPIYAPGKDVRAISNPIEIEIVAKSDEKVGATSEGSADLTTAGSSVEATGIKPGTPAPADRPATVSGKVLGADGKPLAGVPLAVKCLDQRRKWAGLRQIQSDERGRFKISDLSAGEIFICYEKGSKGVPERAGDAKLFISHVRVEAGKTVENITIDLSKATCVVKGRLVGPEGKGIAGASVQALYAPSWVAHTVWTKTDEHGRYRIAGLPPHEFRVFAHAKGHYGGPGKLISLTPGRTETIDMLAYIPSRPAPEPKPDDPRWGRPKGDLRAAIELRPSRETYAIGEIVELKPILRNTGAKTVTLVHDFAGAAELRVTDEAGKGRTFSYKGFSGRTVSTTYVLQSGHEAQMQGSIRLKLVGADSREGLIQKPGVLAFPMKCRPGTRYTFSYDLGEGLRTGEVHLAVKGRIEAGTTNTPPLDTAEDKDSAKPAAAPAKTTVRGKVVDDATGKPVADFITQGGKFDLADPAKVVWGYSETRSDRKDGKFSATVRWPEGWTARIVAAGYLPQPVLSKPPSPGQNVIEVIIRLKRGDTIRGRVLDHTGQGVAKAGVYLAGGGGVIGLAEGPWGEFQGPSVRTGAEGRFEISGRGKGSKAIFVTAPSLFVWRADLPEPDREAIIRLPEPAKLHIRYDIEGGPPAAKVRIELRTWDMPKWSALVDVVRWVDVKAGEDGLVVDNLPPGIYDISRIKHARAGNTGKDMMLDRQLKLTLTSGKTTAYNLVRKTGTPISGDVVGLPKEGVDGVFVYVRDQRASGDPRKRDEWKLRTFDGLVLEGNGRFKTERVGPGKYKVVVEAYKQATRAGMGSLGWRLPKWIGTASVNVPESGEPPKVRLMMRPYDAH